MNEQSPHWQPITMLPVFIEMVEGMLHTSLEQQGCLQWVYDKPELLDDATLTRVIKQYSKQLRDHWLIEEQVARWHREIVSSSETRELERLVTLTEQLKESKEAVLKIACSLDLDALNTRTTGAELGQVPASSFQQSNAIKAKE